MALSRDYYSVLGVPSTASRVTIHAAWKALLRQYHPDANHGVDVSARAKEINEAYSVLGKKEARAAYDRSQIRPSAHRATADRPFHPRKAGRRAMRPSPSMQPGGSLSKPLETNEWLMGLFLLILTAAPIATILVLWNEESGLAPTVRRSVAANPVPKPRKSRPQLIGHKTRTWTACFLNYRPVGTFEFAGSGAKSGSNAEMNERPKLESWEGGGDV